MIKKVKISIITSIYNGIPYLDSFFQNYLKIENLYEIELIIIHNQPTLEEKIIINKYINLIPHLIIEDVELEGLYTSWNRAIKLSNGKYIAIWSIDDIRTSDGLWEQTKLLDLNKDAMIVTGNYYKVFNYGDTKGYYKVDKAKPSILNNFPKFNNGCFLMWRKIVHDHIGYFDEQFKVGGDWEFWCRITSKFKPVTTNTNLGYFLRISNKGLSKNIKQQNAENQIINLRYYNFFLINIYVLIKQKQIKLNKILYFGTYHQLEITKPLIFIRVIPSLLFFWVNLLLKRIVKLRYWFFNKRQIYANN